jgi:PAS domain S-box-containing protein
MKTIGNLTNLEVLYKKKNGERFWGLVSYTRVRDEQGKLFMDGALRDITIQKRAEDQLRISQRLLSSINRNISEGIYRSVPGRGFVYVNPAFLDLFGFNSLEDLNKVNPGDLYSDRKTSNLIRREIAREGELHNHEVIFKRKDGEKFWGSISSILVKEDDGKTYIDGAVRDISRQKESEKQLIDSRNFIDNVMRTVAAPIFVKDSKHRWIMFNDAFCWFMGKSRKELLRKTDKDFLKKDEVKGFWATANRVLRTGEVVLNRESVTLSNGRVRHLLTVKSRYINDGNEKFVIGFITDITEIRKAEERMNELNANLQGIMESTHESIYALDRNYCYLAFNKNHARMAKLLYGVDIRPGDSKLAYIEKTEEKRWLKRD